MTHLIDKDALVAEIEKCIYRCNEKKRSCPVNTQIEAICDNKINAYNEVLSFIDTLEVKEVQEEPKDKCNGCNNVKGCITCVDGSEWAHYEYVDNNKSITQADSYVKAHEDICDRKEPVSIWHDASEIPEKKKWILLVHKEGWYHVGRLYEGQRRNLVIFDGVSTFELNMFNKWVYVDDI